MHEVEYQGRVITIKRETWANGYHVVARDDKGRWLARRKWHSAKDTQIVDNAIRDKYLLPAVPSWQPKKRYRITVLVTCKRTSTTGRYPTLERFKIHFSVRSSEKRLTQRNENEIRSYLERSLRKSGGTVIVEKIEVHRIYDLFHKRRIL